MVLLPIFNHSCLSAAVPIVPGVVNQIINTLLILLSAHQSSSQSNILITALPLMLLRSGMNSLMMCAVQHQLPPSERSLKLYCLQKPICHSLPVSLFPLCMTWLCPLLLNFSEQRNSHHSVPQFMKVRCKKDICMGKSKKDMCPFSYWRAREANSESTGVVNFIKVRRQKKKCSVEMRALARLALKKN